MKGFLAFVWCLAVAGGFTLKHDDDEGEWRAWKDLHGKTYASEREEAARKAVWRENVKVQ